MDRWEASGPCNQLLPWLTTSRPAPGAPIGLGRSRRASSVGDGLCPAAEIVDETGDRAPSGRERAVEPVNRGLDRPPGAGRKRSPISQAGLGTPSRPAYAAGAAEPRSGII